MPRGEILNAIGMNHLFREGEPGGEHVPPARFIDLMEQTRCALGKLYSERHRTKEGSDQSRLSDAIKGVQALFLRLMRASVFEAEMQLSEGSAEGKEAARDIAEFVSSSLALIGSPQSSDSELVRLRTRIRNVLES